MSGNIRFLLLTTQGRKSGKWRTVPLAVIPSGPNYILVASFGGSPVQPNWLTNIRHNSVVYMTIGSATNKHIAWIIEPVDAEYVKFWSEAVAIHPIFDSYARATSRRIPIVVIALTESDSSDIQL